MPTFRRRRFTPTSFAPVCEKPSIRIIPAHEEEYDMSDYMFMLENHLNAEQSRFVSELQAACAPLNTNVFLAGGAMRDMLGGFPLRDLDFTVEANAVKMAKALASAVGATIVSTDDLRKSVEMVLPGGSTVQLAMARSEKYLKAGGKAHVTPGNIHEDLRCRDFTINAIALSLGKASRGLLLDPTNGLADIERRELRTVHSHALSDDPIRLWRLIRLKVRLGFSIEERTLSQFANARQAELTRHIAPRAIFEQLRLIAAELNPADTLRALEEEGMVQELSSALTGPKLNAPGFNKLLKTRQLIPFGFDLKADNMILFLDLIAEKLTPREKSGLFKAIGIERAETAKLNQLAAKAKKLESALKSAKLVKASQVYRAIVGEPAEVPLYLCMRSSQRLVQDRIRNYLTKYLQAASEVTDQEILAEGLNPDMPKFAKRKAEKIAARLDARIRKPVAPPPVEMVAPAATSRRIL